LYALVGFFGWTSRVIRARLRVSSRAYYMRAPHLWKFIGVLALRIPCEAFHGISCRTSLGVFPVVAMRKEFFWPLCRCVSLL